MIENETSKISYTVSSSAVYQFPVRFFEPSDIAVYLDSRRLTRDLDFSVESKSDYTNGAAITLKTGGAFAALPVGSTLTIMRQLPYRQMTSFPQYGKFPAKENENQLDKIVCQIQQLAEMTGVEHYDPIAADFRSAANHFAVIDVSADGVFKVRVINGKSPGNTNCGTLNGVAIPVAEITLDPGNPQYYIYAVGNTLYAITHRIDSDALPILLCATVHVGSTSLYIRQENFADDPVIAVRSGTSAIRISAEPVYSAHTLSLSYTATVAMLHNNTPVTVTAQLPQNLEGETASLIVYVRELTVPVNETADTGFAFLGTANADDTSYEWGCDILRYTLSDTSFQIRHISDAIQFFTFAIIPEQ